MTDSDHIEQLTEKLRKAGVSLVANANIADHLNDEDINAIQREAERHISGLLKSLLIEGDVNTTETPKRVARMYVGEAMKGRFLPAPDVTKFPNTAPKTGNFYMVGPVTVRSLCSHHLVPVVGKCVIALTPGEDVIGLSKFNRLVDWVMSRPQMQEEATQQILEQIILHTGAAQIALAVQADHLCCQWRGVKDSSKMLTWGFHGVIEDEAAIRQDILHLMNVPVSD